MEFIARRVALHFWILTYSLNNSTVAAFAVTPAAQGQRLSVPPAAVYVSGATPTVHTLPEYILQLCTW